jgi:hypothetical protein
MTSQCHTHLHRLHATPGDVRQHLLAVTPMPWQQQNGNALVRMRRAPWASSTRNHCTSLLLHRRASVICSWTLHSLGMARQEGMHGIHELICEAMRCHHNHEAGSQRAHRYSSDVMLARAAGRLPVIVAPLRYLQGQSGGGNSVMGRLHGCSSIRESQLQSWQAAKHITLVSDQQTMSTTCMHGNPAQDDLVVPSPWTPTKMASRKWQAV